MYFVLSQSVCTHLATQRRPFRIRWTMRSSTRSTLHICCSVRSTPSMLPLIHRRPLSTVLLDSRLQLVHFVKHFGGLHVGKFLELFEETIFEYSTGLTGVASTAVSGVSGTPGSPRKAAVPTRSMSAQANNPHVIATNKLPAANNHVTNTQPPIGAAATRRSSTGWLVIGCWVVR